MPWNLPAGVVDRRGASGIFISYRRDDAPGHVIALMDPLHARFDAAHIFKDTDSIPPGRDFVEEVKRQLGSCAVMLAVIGREWLTIQHPRHGGRRLDDPEDLVRLEVSTALAMRDVLVVPVLVDGAAMPSEDDLPPDLKPLARRNNVELTNRSWKKDTEHLFDVIERAIAATIPHPLWKRASAYSVHVLVMMVLVLGAVLAVREGTEWFASSPVDTKAPSPADPGSTVPGVPINKPAAPEPKASGNPTPETPPPADKPISTTGTDSAPKTTPRRPSPTPASGSKEPAAHPPSPIATGGPRANGETGLPPETERPRPTNVPRQNETGDRDGILAALERFRQAYNAKNAQAVSAVYPDVRTDRMFRDMQDCARVTLTFGDPLVNVLSATAARVQVPATYGCRPSTAQREMVSQETDEYFFERRGGAWVIESRLARVDSKK